jgi:hypothetical protein
VIVDRVRSRGLDGQLERSARVRWHGGEFDLRIAVPPEFAPAPEDASPFLAAALQLAMRRREDLQIDGPVSPLLLRRCEWIQQIYAAWDPTLSHCELRASAEIEPSPGRDAAASFFSRGVDSTCCAAVEREESIGLLVFCDGLEPRHDQRVRAEEMRLARVVAEQIGLPLVTTSTNLRELTDPLVRDWEDYVAPALAFVAHSLAGGLRRAVVPSSDSYATLEPCGTSPLLDPLFSTEAVVIEHDTVTRGHGAKVAWLAVERPDLLRLLKVCYVENRPDNCGRCGKCLVTMAELQVAGALHMAELFPNEIDLDAVAQMRIMSRKARFDFVAVFAALGASETDRRLRVAIETALDNGARDLAARVREGRFEPLSFRGRHMDSCIAMLREQHLAVDTGSEEAPPASASADAAVGLVRALDDDRGCHVYSAGKIAWGLRAVELGRLHSQPHDGSVPLWITAEGRALTPTHIPSIEPAPLRASLRWAFAPLAWRGFARFSRRAGAVIWRLGWLAKSHEDGEPVSATRHRAGFLHENERDGRLSLYSAVHPITGDQLLTTWRWEATDLGYAQVTLLGYLDPCEPPTGRLAGRRPHVPWASRFGQRVRAA